MHIYKLRARLNRKSSCYSYKLINLNVPNILRKGIPQLWSCKRPVSLMSHVIYHVVVAIGSSNTRHN